MEPPPTEESPTKSWTTWIQMLNMMILCGYNLTILCFLLYKLFTFIRDKVSKNKRINDIFYFFHRIMLVILKRKGLKDMPIEIVDKILSNLDNSVEKIRLRGVCSGFRDIIDYQMSRCKTVSIVFSENLIHLRVDKVFFHYVSNEENSPLYETLKGHMKVYDIGTLKKNALGHIEYLLKNRRTKLDRFLVVDILPRLKESGEASDLESILSTLDHKLHVKSVGISITPQNNYIRLLQHLKPGVLVRICLEIEGEDLKEEDLEELCQTEQWKMAIDRDIHADTSVDFSISVSFLRQATSFSIDRPDFIPEEIVLIREILFKSPNFKSGEICSLEAGSSINFAPIKDALGAHIADPNEPERCFYPIPDSNEFLEFEFSEEERHISIRRIKTLSIVQ